ncbi:MAG: DNA translocase FtsK [Bacilli bacterium]
MAKRKSRKDESKKEFQYTKELEGLLLILIGIIGFGKDFGPVGKIIKSFAIFLCGNWYVIVLIFALIFGIYLIAKRKKMSMHSARIIGVFVLVTVVLLLSHLSYLKDNNLTGVAIFRETIDNIMNAVNNFSLLRDTGGGMIGALFSFIFVTLLGLTGTTIVAGVMAVFGIIMLFDITLFDMFKIIIKPFQNAKIKSKENKRLRLSDMQKEAAGKEMSSLEDDGRVVITSVNEFTHQNEPIINTPVSTQNNIEVKEGTYRLPPIDLLDKPKNPSGKINSNEFIVSNCKILERVFNDFGIVGKVRDVHEGPTVTQYEVELKAGTKVNKVLSINREIALAMAATEVRIEAPIPGKSTIGIEIPNRVQASVLIREVVANIPKKLDNSMLVAPLGKDIMGNIQFYEINKAPHMLVAGATGSGKSVCINNILVSILLRARPDEVKLILVDPKKVELNIYDGVPHLMRPVVTDPKKASVALQKVVEEMDRRYELFNSTETKNIATYNEYIEKKNGKKLHDIEKLPFILIVIDELADLMLVAAKEVESSIMRITQLARAAGIHLIVATQRPSTDVITGLIKSNIPTRISFAVSSSIDSRTILDMMGAEKLLGKGDMLFYPMGAVAPVRIQGSFVSDDEIKRVVDFVKSQGTPKYDDKMLELDNNYKEGEIVNESSYPSTDEDPLYNEIVEFAISTGKISASLLQRKYRLGYNRAARIIDDLEEKGIIGGSNGSKPRNVLVKLEGNKNLEGHEE